MLNASSRVIDIVIRRIIIEQKIFMLTIYMFCLHQKEVEYLNFLAVLNRNLLPCKSEDA